jgi:uncharacterized membrane protein
MVDGMIDAIICVVIYSAAFALAYIKSGTSVVLNYEGDRSGEYLHYSRMVETGKWSNTYLVDSCLFSTYIPAIFQRLTGCDSWLIFRISSPIFYALMPVFGYLIAREYNDYLYSLIAALFILGNFYFTNGSDTGRNGIGQAFLSGALWGVISGNYIAGVVFALLIPLAHYGTTFVALFILGFTAVLTPFGNWQAYPPLIALMLSIVAWYGMKAKRAGIVMRYVLSDVMEGKPLPGVKPNLAYYIETRLMNDTSTANSFRWKLPGRVEISVSLIIAGLIITGFMTGFYNLDILFASLSIASLTLIFVTILSPWLCYRYGAMRVFFSTLPVLATLFISGSVYVSEATGLTGYGIAAGIAGIYALCTSGGLKFILGVK